jgi:hypothetical protein
MKIAGTGPIQTSSIRRRARRDGVGESAFSEHLDQPRSPAAASGAAPMSGIDGLLALQEVDDEGRQRRQARDHGEAILDRLDDIRHALLTGTLNPESLERLLKQVRSKRGNFTDPRLREVLDEIELRAAVELAKMGRAA